ncbi:MAG: DNA polymerase III subunit delta [Burkholderiaceae bacterium]|jgi:DNA polymerase-3 subunit delta|nr:DNA polymerase III subunit delta [Burkholderiaceae bacterium]
MQLRPDALDEHLGKTLAPLYVVSSNEPLLIIEASDKIRETAKNRGYTERDVLTVERGFKWDSLNTASQTLSLFGEKKLIELRIPNGRPGKEGSQVLQDYVNHLHTDNITLITLPGLDRATRTSKWASALQAHAVYIDIPLVERHHMGSWIAKRLQKQHQQADDESIRFLVDCVEGNLLAAHQEIQKLGLLYPKGQLEREQVRVAVLNVARYDVYKLGEAMLTGDVSRFVHILEGLRGEGQPPNLALWALTREIRTLLRLRAGMDKGLPAASLFKTLGVWASKEKIFSAALKRLDTDTLHRALQQTADSDRIVKGLHVASMLDDAWTALLRLGLAIASPAGIVPAAVH